MGPPCARIAGAVPWVDGILQSGEDQDAPRKFPLVRFELYADDAVRPGPRTRPHASAADGRATAAAASRVAAVRGTQRAAGPRAASAVTMAGEIARLKPVDS